MIITIKAMSTASTTITRIATMMNSGTALPPPPPLALGKEDQDQDQEQEQEQEQQQQQQQQHRRRIRPTICATRPTL